MSYEAQVVKDMQNCLNSSVVIMPASVVRKAIKIIDEQKARIHDLETLVDRIDHEDTVRFGGRSYD